ncbi:DEAD/DEAH box helicase family protein [Polaribacter sp. HaHaR_3_91]|uniref:DEAD/DEAH box helicase family protein n=1 Tax=Polaribacter sp. HaHaR_3_91 TaxID=2745561 RepID=UPI001C4FBD99|nr:DEAD/DEAH box helicase family protein [Polaribacter sp. HaHaR_3_91]QXP63247.1 type I restriction endonuclease subunit R [Polaribacter sp. HaHaR_3_91]
MPSNKETLFQDHLCNFLKAEHNYQELSKDVENEYHFIQSDIIQFIQTTQPDKYKDLKENFGADADNEILKALKYQVSKKALWLIVREGLTVKGTKIKLYEQKPRNATNITQLDNYYKNTFTYKKEYYYNPNTKERIDIVIWLNGLPVIVLELKHEDEGQDVNDAIHDSFLNRDLKNNLYKLPFLYVALSNTEAKIATNPSSESFFRWFNASLTNKAEMVGEYPVEHVYRYALSPENITHYLEHYLVFVPVKEEEVNGEWQKTDSFTIFPRYHQFRASKGLAVDVQKFCEGNQSLGKKYLINHSAGSGKTLTIAWMADRLDSLYTNDGKKVFDNIIILTDRKALDKNVKDDLELFSHLGTKINFAKKSKKLAEYLEKDRDIIVTTIHKFSHIQEKLQKDDLLKNRNVAFLIDEAHRSQDGKMALTMHKFFNEDSNEEIENQDEDENIKELEKLNISNQVFVAFTATTTPKTVAFFGEPFDVYSEAEAIAEGYILDVALNIISYETLYNLKLKEAIPEKDFPTGIVSKLLKNIAYEDDGVIQYKAEVIVKLFEEKVVPSIKGQGKAMVVTSSRVAGLKYFNTLKTILEETNSEWKVLYAFSDFTHPETKESIEEDKVNNLKGKLIEDVFASEGNRILVVANKFQTGFDQPLLSTMFLDKSINGVNAVQTVSRLNRKHKDKEQDDILVVDFTNNAQNIFDAFNHHREGSPYKDQQPKKEVLVELFNEIAKFKVFTEEEIELYCNAFIDAEIAAKKERNATPDAILSNLTQDYRDIFKAKIGSLEGQKRYVSLLRRYAKLYYFIAQFFELDKQLDEFIIFAEVMGGLLIRKGKTSDMKEFLEKVELSKGAVKYLGTKTNLKVVADPKPKTGFKTGKGGSEIPRTTIEMALEDLKSKYQISDEDVIVIKEICENVSENTSAKEKVIANKNNPVYLKISAEPKVRSEVIDEYINRQLLDKLDDPIYSQKGGIISLIGKTVIQNIIKAVS